MSSSRTWRNDWQRGLENPNPPPFARFSSTCTRARGCSQQTKSWTTGRPRRWPDTGSPRIRICSPGRTKTSRFQLQRLLLDQDLHGRQTRGGSQLIRRHPDHLQSSPGDLQARCRVERSLLWEITGSLAAATNDLRVGKQLLFSKSKILVKQTVFNRAHTKNPKPTSSIQR